MIQNTLCLAALLAFSFIATIIASAFRTEERDLRAWFDSEGFGVLALVFLGGFAAACQCNWFKEL